MGATALERIDGAIPSRHRPRIPSEPYQSKIEKSQVGGYAALDSTGLVPTNQLGTGTPTASKTLLGDRSWSAFVATLFAFTQTDVLLGRQTAGAGAGEEIALTAAGRALIDDANAAAQRTTLGLAALATKSTVATADIDNDAVTYAKIQNVSATDKVLGRSSGGAGDVEEIACTAAGRALIDDAAASDQRTTLGLGDSATKNVGTAAGTVAAGDHAHAATALTGRTTFYEFSLGTITASGGTAAPTILAARNNKIVHFEARLVGKENTDLGPVVTRWRGMAQWNGATLNAYGMTEIDETISRGLNDFTASTSVTGALSVSSNQLVLTITNNFANTITGGYLFVDAWESDV